MTEKPFYGNYVQPALFEETDLVTKVEDTELENSVQLEALELEKERWLELYNEAEANLFRIASEMDSLSR